MGSMNTRSSCTCCAAAADEEALLLWPDWLYIQSDQSNNTTQASTPIQGLAIRATQGTPREDIGANTLIKPKEDIYRSSHTSLAHPGELPRCAEPLALTSWGIGASGLEDTGYWDLGYLILAKG